MLYPGLFILIESVKAPRKGQRCTVYTMGFPSTFDFMLRNLKKSCQRTNKKGKLLSPRQTVVRHGSSMDESNPNPFWNFGTRMQNRVQEIANFPFFKQFHLIFCCTSAFSSYAPSTKWSSWGIITLKMDKSSALRGFVDIESWA